MLTIFLVIVISLLYLLTLLIIYMIPKWPHYLSFDKLPLLVF